MNKVSCNHDGIKIALKSIKNGGIVIFPTDTVYGIGCDPYNKDALNKIYEIKKRDTKIKYSQF
jgi:L-threonylcarbamoyladenylate synthase